VLGEYPTTVFGVTTLPVIATAARLSAELDLATVFKGVKGVGLASSMGLTPPSSPILPRSILSFGIIMLTTRAFFVSSFSGSLSLEL
jgi:hypothetical protein